MAEETDRIAILLQARDKDFARAMDRSNKLIAKFEKGATRGTTRAARNVEASMTRAGASIRAFAGGAIAGVLAGALAAVTSNLAGTIRGIASIGDEAKRSGLGAEVFQELAFVAEQSRIPVDALIDGMKELSLRADEFVQTGGGSAAESFKRLGLNAAALQRGLEDPSELLLDIIDRMEDMDRAAQIRVADEIFGGTGGERFVELISQGEAGIRDIMQTAHEAGLVLDEDVIAKAAEIDREFSRLRSSIRTAFQAATVETVHFIRNARAELDAMAPAAMDALRGAPAVNAPENLANSEVKANYEDLVRLSRELTVSMGLTASALEQAGFDELAGDLRASGREMDNLGEQFAFKQITVAEFAEGLEDATDEANDLIAEASRIDGIKTDNAVSAIGALTTALGAAYNRAVDLIGALPGAVPAAEGTQPGPSFEEGGRGSGPAPTFFAPSTSVRPQLPGIDASFGTPGPRRAGSGGGGGGGAASDYERATEAIRERTAALELEAAELIAVAAGGHQMGDAFEYARRRAELLHAAQKDGREITPELRAEIDDLAMSLTAAGQRAETAAERIDLVRENAERGADAISDVFLSALEGADEAKRAVLALLVEIARVNFRKNLMNSSGGGGLFGWLGGLLSGKRARGGPAAAGGAYLVNENTPNSEIFVPSQSGGVLNVPQAQAALRNQGGGNGIAEVRVIGGDLTLTDDGRISARIRVTAAQSGQQAVQTVKANLRGWQQTLDTNGALT